MCRTLRHDLLRQLTGPTAVVGPALDSCARLVRPPRAPASCARAVRAFSPDVRDTEEYLPELVLSADAFADLRARALAPLRTLPGVTARRLEETLRAWMLHQGRRDEVAVALFVHPQTVRYRMSQLRELPPDLASPHRVVLALMLAVGLRVSWRVLRPSTTESVSSPREARRGARDSWPPAA